MKYIYCFTLYLFNIMVYFGNHSILVYNEFTLFFLMAACHQFMIWHSWFHMSAQLLSCVQLSATLGTVPCQVILSMGFSRQQHWSGVLQGIFPTQGLNLCLLHWQANPLPPSHLGSPVGFTELYYWTLRLLLAVKINVTNDNFAYITLYVCGSILQEVRYLQV